MDLARTRERLEVSHTVVMRGGAIGDFILTTPAIDAMRPCSSRDGLCIIGRPTIACLAHPDYLLDSEGASATCLYAEEGPVTAEVREQLADARVVLAYTTYPESKLRRRLRGLTDGEVWVHDPRPTPGARLHMVEHLLCPLRRHGVPIGDPVPRLQVGARDREYAAGVPIGGSNHVPLVLLHPGSGGPHKCWPPRRFALLAGQLCRRGCRVAVIWGPVEAERGSDLTDQLDEECPVLCPPDLPSLAGLLAMAHLFIGNDSGPGHMAAAVGIATLSLFGPTDPVLWCPRSPASRVLVAPGGDLRTLAVDSVRRAAEEQLGRQPGRCHVG